jgi:hypothetical protein
MEELVVDGYSWLKRKNEILKDRSLKLTEKEEEDL